MKELASDHTACPICGSTNLKRRWEINSYPIDACQECSLVFVNKNVTPEQLAAHYETAIDQAYSDDNVSCLMYYYKNLGKLIREYHPESGRLLDVGCSGGWFFDAMAGWECHGNEMVSAYAAIAHQRCENRIFHGSFEEYPIRPNYFDVITMQDVFDHMPDPSAALQKCYSMLKPQGLLVIKVHNISCLYARLMGQRFYALVPPSHLFYYNRSTLQLALKKNGFTFLRARFMPHLLTIRTVLLRLSRNNSASFWHKIYRKLDDSWLGNLRIRKNLHDVITVFALRSGVST